MALIDTRQLHTPTNPQPLETPMKLLRIILATATVAILAAAMATSAFAASTVHVTMKAMKFHVSGAAHPGKVTLVVSNRDAVPHIFTIAGKKTPLLKKGKTARLTVRLKKGKVAYKCTMHPMMKGTLTVR
jgi:plastocyanin